MKPPQPLLPLGARGPHLIQHFLGRPHSQLQTAARSFHSKFTHFHTTTQQSPHWLQWNVPYPTKIAPSRETTANPNYLPLVPHPWTEPTRHSNGTQIQSAVFPQFTGQTDRATDRWSRRQNRTYSRLRSINDSDAANNRTSSCRHTCFIHGTGTRYTALL